jgi:hypothetical protein
MGIQLKQGLPLLWPVPGVIHKWCKLEDIRDDSPDNMILGNLDLEVLPVEKKMLLLEKTSPKISNTLEIIAEGGGGGGE